MYTNLVGYPSCYIPFKEFSNVNSLSQIFTHFKICELIYQVNMVDLGSLCSFSKKTKMISFIKDMSKLLRMQYKVG